MEVICERVGKPAVVHAWNAKKIGRNRRGAVSLIGFGLGDFDGSGYEFRLYFQVNRKLHYKPKPYYDFTKLLRILSKPESR